MGCARGRKWMGCVEVMLDKVSGVSSTEYQ